MAITRSSARSVKLGGEVWSAVSHDETQVLDLIAVEVEEEELFEARLDKHRVQGAAGHELPGAFRYVDASAGESVDVDV